MKVNGRFFNCVKGDFKLYIVAAQTYYILALLNGDRIVVQTGAVNTVS